MKNSVFLSVVLAAAVSVGCNDNARTDVNEAGRNDSIGTSGDASNTVSAGDKSFFEDLTIAGMAEVELGKMAAMKGASAEVKKFGQMMVDDHTKAGDQLKALAAQHNVVLPTAVDDEHRELHDRLAKLSGVEFDREYINAMVDGHQDVLDKLGARVDSTNANAVAPEESDNVVTMGINRWAADAYPVVQRHLENAKMIDGTLDRSTAR
jgi:putative membrane protein